MHATVLHIPLLLGLMAYDKIPRLSLRSGKDQLAFMFSQAALNASLNGLSAILLAGGYAAIRAGKRDVHKVFMVSAFAVSTVFLASYLLYHYRVGHVVFHGQGWIRTVYFALLFSHTTLAVVIVPLVLITLRRAW